MILPRTAPGPDDVGRHYDALDAFYRELWGDDVHHGYFATGRETIPGATESLTLRVLDAVAVGEGARAVDIGCGYGATARRAAARGADVTALTLSDAQAAVARQDPTGPGRLTVHVRDWLDNGLPGVAFDAAWAVESTTHMPDRPRVFAEVARVLRPGGRFALCVWMTGPSPSSWEVRHLLEPICREGRLAGLGTADENRRWVEGAGLVVERAEDWSRAVAPTWTRVARGVARGVLTDARYRRFLRDASQADRVFAVTIGRLALAYRTGALRYGFVVARKP